MRKVRSAVLYCPVLHRACYLVCYVQIKRLACIYCFVQLLIDIRCEHLFHYIIGSQGWHENQNDDAPFVRYMLGVIAAAYRDFSTRVQVLVTSDLSKPNRIRAIIKGTLGKITKADIMKQCPDISAITVQRTLSELQKSGEILKLSGGRYTAYTWNRERE